VLSELTVNEDFCRGHLCGLRKALRLYKSKSGRLLMQAG
jgi:hypothetical protein